MTDDLVKRLQKYLDGCPPPNGRTFHLMHEETLIAEAKHRIEALEAAQRKICDGPRDADKSYPELLAEVRIEARAALAGEKKDE